MTTPAAPPSYSPRELWVNRGLAVLSLGLFVYWLQEYLRGVPDFYHNQHSRGMLLALAMFCQNVASAFKLQRRGWALMAASMGLLAACFWLSFR